MMEAVGHFMNSFIKVLPQSESILQWLSRATNCNNLETKLDCLVVMDFIASSHESPLASSLTQDNYLGFLLSSMYLSDKHTIYSLRILGNLLLEKLPLEKVAETAVMRNIE